MDFSKYPLERFFYFIAGIIPGLVALLISAPGSVRWFLGLTFLGYRTKLSLIALVAFVVGNSLTAFLTALLGSLGGAYGAVVGMRPYEAPSTYPIAPWRDPRWRSVLKKRLGAQTPNDTVLHSPELFSLKLRAVELIPEGQRAVALAELNLEKTRTEIDDSNWAQWYDHYRGIVYQPKNPDPVVQVRHGLGFNLETTSLYVLVSAVFVPSLRHWWCILPSCLWILILIAQEYSGVKRFTNIWSTLSDQINYLDAGGS